MNYLSRVSVRAVSFGIRRAADRPEFAAAKSGSFWVRLEARSFVFNNLMASFVKKDCLICAVFCPLTCVGAAFHAGLRQFRRALKRHINYIFHPLRPRSKPCLERLLRIFVANCIGRTGKAFCPSRSPVVRTARDIYPSIILPHMSTQSSKTYGTRRRFLSSLRGPATRQVRVRGMNYETHQSPDPVPRTA